MNASKFFRNMFAVLAVANVVVGNVAVAAFCFSVATAIQVGK
jgi:hypothetical protein